MSKRLLKVTIGVLILFFVNSIYTILNNDFHIFFNFKFLKEVQISVLILTMLFFSFFLYKKGYILAMLSIILVDIIQILMIIDEESFILTLIYLVIVIITSFVFIFSASKKSVFLRFFGVSTILYFITILVAGLLGLYLIIEIATMLFPLTSFLLILEVYNESKKLNVDYDDVLDA